MSVYGEYQAPSTGQFLKFEDGKANKIRLMSEPFLFTSSFTDKSTGEVKISTKYAWVIFNHDVNEGQIMQLPVSAFKMIQELATNDDWGDPTAYNLTVKRTGSGVETKYSVMPGLKTSVTKEMTEAVKDLEVTKAIKNAIPLAQVIEGKPIPEPESSADDKPPVDQLTPPDDVDVDGIPF